MKPLYWLADIFIDVFGITRPTAKTRDRAAWFIAGLLALVLLAVGAVAALALHFMRR